MNPFMEENLWGITERFYLSLIPFRIEYKKYRERIKRSSQRLHREGNKYTRVLNIEEIETLLHHDCFAQILEKHLNELKEVLVDLGKERLPNNLLGHYVVDIFHELSILSDGCNRIERNVPQYISCQEEEECLSITQEINAFLPLKMMHLANLFQKAQRELETLIRQNNENQILLRSIFLYGKEVIAPAYENGLDEFLNKIYKRGSFQAYLAIAKSFYEASFYSLSQKALSKAVEIHENSSDHSKAGEQSFLLQALQDRIGASHKKILQVL